MTDSASHLVSASFVKVRERLTAVGTAARLVQSEKWGSGMCLALVSTRLSTSVMGSGIAPREGRHMRVTGVH